MGFFLSDFINCCNIIQMNMDTPRIIRRTTARAEVATEVRRSNSRTRLFSPSDSGVEVSPSPRTPLGTQTGKKLGGPFRIAGHTSPKRYQGMDVQGRVDGLETHSENQNGWFKFWLIWLSCWKQWVCNFCIGIFPREQRTIPGVCNDWFVNDNRPADIDYRTQNDMAFMQGWTMKTQLSVCRRCHGTRS